MSLLLTPLSKFYMYTRTILCFLILVLPLLAYSRQGESSQPDVLENYVQEALRSNLTLQQQQNAYQQSLQSLAQARALFLPSAGISATYSLAQGGRNISIPVGDLLNPVYATLNQLTDSQMFPQIANVSEQFLPNRFHETKLRVVQPLFNSDIWYNYKAQQQMVSVQDAKRMAYENELKGTVREAYFNYLQAAEAVRVYENTLLLVNEQLQLTERFFAAQTVTRDAVYNVQLEKSRVEAMLADAEKNSELAQSWFNFLLNRDLQEEIEIDLRFAGEEPVISLNQNLQSEAEIAFVSRHELTQLEKAEEASRYLVELNGARRIMPNLSVIGDLGYQGFDYRFDGDQQFSMLIFSLQWELFKGGARKAAYQSAVLQRSNLELQEEQLRKQIELEVTRAYEEVKTAKKNLESSADALAAAESSFRITRARFAQNQVLPIEYQQAQNNYTNAQLTHTIAKYKLYRSLNELDKVTGQL